MVKHPTWTVLVPCDAEYVENSVERKRCGWDERASTLDLECSILADSTESQRSKSVLEHLAGVAQSRGSRAAQQGLVAVTTVLGHGFTRDEQYERDVVQRCLGKGEKAGGESCRSRFSVACGELLALESSFGAWDVTMGTINGSGI